MKWAEHLLRNIPPERWICTASLARTLALPGKLEGSGAALGLKVQKDPVGHKLMLKYCKPRKVTKKNPNVFHNDAADLRRIMLYCDVDVIAEVGVFLELPPLLPKERELWILDQKINLRGFRVDRELVAIVLKMIDEETSNLNKETVDVTFGALATAMQRDGVLDWLEKEGVKLPNLQAKTVSDAISTGLVTGDLKRILEIRQAVSKTSTAKYKGYIARTETDSILRDILVFHTASTGRWGGAGIQPQNFPRGIQGINSWLAAEILREGDLELVRLMYGDPMNAFASCLRAMIVARDGKEFFCADYVGIELHVLFWMAKHEAGLEALRKRVDMYVEMAVEIYNKPKEQISKESRERFIGKESVLGCFTPETLVLTRRGWAPIVEVTPEDKVFDGENWVSHTGVICQGEKSIIRLSGIGITPDHLLLSGTSWIAANRVVLESTGYLESALATARLKLEGLSSASAEARSISSLPAPAPQIKSISSTLVIYLMESLARVSAALKSFLSLQVNIIGATPISSPGELSGSAYLTGSVPPYSVAITQKINATNITAVEVLKYSGRGGEIAGSFFVTSPLLETGKTRSAISIGSTLIKGIVRVISALLRDPRTRVTGEVSPASSQRSKDLKEKSLVYDVTNAGPLNRFMILSDRGPLIVHNCGYQMGGPTFRKNCLKKGVEIDEETSERAVKAYREKHSPVRAMWYNTEKAAIAATLNRGKKYTVNRVSWYVKGKFLYAELPGGKALAYYGPEIRYEPNKWTKEKQAKLYHWGVNPITKKWEIGPTYGGRLTENVVQGCARNLMAEAMLRIDRAGYDIVLSVHDELLAEAPIGTKDIENFKNLMAELPPWAEGLPVRVEGWTGSRYKK